MRLSFIGSKQGSLVKALSFIKYSVREAESSSELFILIPTTLDLVSQRRGFFIFRYDSGMGGIGKPRVFVDFSSCRGMTKNHCIGLTSMNQTKSHSRISRVK